MNVYTELRQDGYHAWAPDFAVTGLGPTAEEAIDAFVFKNSLSLSQQREINIMPLLPEPPKATPVIGSKFDEAKLQWSLLPFGVLQDVVFVLMMGAKKYSVDNWKHVKPPVRYFDATMRHLVAYHEGEKYDSESGKSHLVHAICCLMFLLWNVQQEEKEDAPVTIDDSINCPPMGKHLGGAELAREAGLPTTYPGAG